MNTKTLTSVLLGAGVYYLMSSGKKQSNYRARFKESFPLFDPDNFFTKDPLDYSIVNNVVFTLKTLLKAIHELGIDVSVFQYGYRDPATNTRIHGHPRSRHLQGLAIDFVTKKDLRTVTEGELEAWGKIFNKNGLSVIFYPFRRHDRSIHVQISKNAPKKRLVFYENKSGKGYNPSYRAAKIS